MEMANKKPKKPGIVEAVDMLMGVIDSGGYDDFLEVLQKNDWWIYVTPISVNYDTKLVGMKKPALNEMRAEALRSYEVQKEKLDKPDPMEPVYRSLQQMRDDEMREKYANKTSATASAIISTLGEADDGTENTQFARKRGREMPLEQILDDEETGESRYAPGTEETANTLLRKGTDIGHVRNMLKVIRDTPPGTQIEIVPATGISEIQITDKFGNAQTSRISPIVLDDD